MRKLEGLEIEGFIFLCQKGRSTLRGRNNNDVIPGVVFLYSGC